MGGHRYGNNGKGNRTRDGGEDKMYFHIFSEHRNIHDEMYTFDSKYYQDLRREAEKIKAKGIKISQRRPPLRLVVDNTKKIK